ncbi:MAG: restriction endonuclease subunit S, partial [Ginsengibacter sp.]
LFSELDKGVENLHTAKQQLKTYRQSVLKCAFEGKLTNENVKEGKLPNGWEITELKTVVDKISDGPFGSNLKSVDYVESGIRVIRLENIGELEFRNEYQTFITNEKYETIKNHTVSKGDIIFSSFISENIRTVILPDYIDRAVNKADCFLVRTSESRINRKYLVYYFSTRALYNQLVEEIHGATRPRINTTQLKAARIPIPSIKEQHNIVQVIESRLSVTDKMGESIIQSLQQAEALRQSILKKAFEGKLI